MYSDEKSDGRGLEAGTEGTPPRTKRLWVIWLAVLAGIIALMYFKDRTDVPGEVLTQFQFEQLVDSNRIASATINYSPQNSALNEIVGKYYKVEKDGNIEVPFRAVVRLTGPLEARLLELPQFQPREPNTVLVSVIYSVLPILLVGALIWFFFIRQIKKAARNSSSTQALQAKQSEQQARFDGVLDKWEAQARRMDAVLDKMERDYEVKK